MSTPLVINEALNAAWDILREDIIGFGDSDIVAIGPRPTPEYAEIHVVLKDGSDLYITVSEKEPS